MLYMPPYDHCFEFFEIINHQEPQIGGELEKPLSLEIPADFEIYGIVLELLNELNLFLVEGQVFSEVDHKVIFIGVVIFLDESVVQQKSRIALLSVGVIDFAVLHQIPECLYFECFPFVVIRPERLFRPLVVDHVYQSDLSVPSRGTIPPVFFPWTLNPKTLEEARHLLYAKVW